MVLVWVGLAFAGDGEALDMDRGSGTLPQEVIADVMKKNNFKVGDCFTKHAFKGQTGRMNVEIEIDLDGSVKAAKKLDSTMGNPLFETCVTDAVKTYKFPAPKNDGTVVTNWPFIF